MSDNPPITTLDLTGGEQSGPAEVVLPPEELAGATAKPGELVLPEAEDDGEGLPKHAVQLADGRIQLPLKFPVTLPVRIGNGPSEKKVFAVLMLRRLNGLDRKTAASQPEDMQTITLAARSAGVRGDLFNALYENMDAEDTAALDRVLGHFLGVGRKTGR